ncbi:MAG: deoxyribodipyrimidine photolyase [Rhodospirillales bacterium]|nr:MAG: deoxyribodipyrimidine photolyase [Rhodospirillales bacterium]
MVETERIRHLNDTPEQDGRYVLYWMQQSQRTRANPALELAVAAANERSLPVVVGFGLTDDYPEANARHYAFMLQGLRDVRDRLHERGIPFVVRRGPPDRVAIGLAGEAALVVCDRGYLRHQKAWRAHVARAAPTRVVQVEGDVVVPLDLASSKREYAARTLRPKIHRHWDRFLVDLDDTEVAAASDAPELASDVDVGDWQAVLATLKVDRSVVPVSRFHGGEAEAERRLGSFLADRFDGYAEGRSEPAAWQCSHLSPYLHFGHISPVRVARAAQQARCGRGEDRAAFLEELIVRRELAANYVNFTPDYDRYDALPNWAQKTLDRHRRDPRRPGYGLDQLEAAATDDPYWNAAMREMTATGFMHNMMRMYWGKMILKWTEEPEAAFDLALRLNNRYFLDGRDANSFTGVAWCFGLHDRPWPERPIFGTVRSMTAGGLERKFRIGDYVEAVGRLVAAECPGETPP